MSVLSGYTAAEMAFLGTINLQGYYAGSTAGGGTFTWLTAAQASGLTPDGGLVIAPSDHPGVCTSGCLVRQFTVVTPYMFGAKSDGATDASTAVQTMVDAVETNFSGPATLSFPSGNWLVNGGIVVSEPGLKFEGPGTIQTPSTWTSTTNSTPSFGTQHTIFFLTADATDVSFDGLKFYGGNTATLSGSDTVQVHFIQSIGARTSITNCSFDYLPIQTSNPVGGLFVILEGGNNSVTDSYFNGEANGVLTVGTFGGGALYFGDPMESLVANDRFYNFNDTDITADSTGAPSLSYGITVTGNYFDGGTYGATAQEGAFTLQSGSYGATFAGNYVRGISEAVWVQNTGASAIAPLGLTVTGNTFDMENGAVYAYSDVAPPYSSFAPSNANGVTLADNTVINMGGSTACGAVCAAFQIGGSNYEISGNIIQTVENSGVSATEGIYLVQTAAGQPVAHLKISGNKFTANNSTAPSAFINVASTTILDDVIIEDNECYANPSAANICVNFQNSTAGQTNVILARNTATSLVSGTPNYGKLYQGSPWGDLAYNALPADHTLDNLSAASTYYVSSNVASPVSLTTGTAANITSISLAPGQWDVSANVLFTPTSATVTGALGWIGTTSATLPSPPNGGSLFNAPLALTATSSGFGWPTGTLHLNLTSQTTVYLEAQAAFSAGTVGAYGFIGATRIH